MEQVIEILPINPGSDGDGRKWPKHHYERNDEYFKERIATDKWIQDLPGGPQPGVTYRLDKMPSGYAGFQKQRADSKHVDRYICGHPNGQFRSLNEFYPHFKHLMDYGGPAGCACKLCTGGSSRAKPKPARPSASAYFADTAGEQGNSTEPVNLISPFKPGRAEPEHLRPKKRKLVDLEGVPDIYEGLIEQLKNAGLEEAIDEPIVERNSPDWRVGNASSKEQADTLRNLPRYVPRPGEVVLFERGLHDGEQIRWDHHSQTSKTHDSVSGTWLTQPKWRAGVVTQIPKEEITDEDLQTDEQKELAVNESGFRIEPLSEPGSDRKLFSKQIKYLPLHALRPFYLWQQCLNGVPEETWHPTIKHALTIASSFCVVGRFRFRGTWPNATVFARGVYLGPELILVGDTVRIAPRKNEQRMDNITEVMAVTAIRLRFVNLDMEDDDMAPELPGLPYQTCLHFSGRMYTLDPKRSFDGVGKVPIKRETLPPGLAAYGTWYHYSDPGHESARTELPYTRILGRCVEDTAIKAWFASDAERPPPSSFQAVNTKPILVQQGDNTELTRGLQGVLEARIYSQKNDARIKSQEGRSWFWADTRIEQLDLPEVNQRDVSVRSKDRTKGQMAKWRATLKAIDGKTGAAEDYQTAKDKLKEKAKAQMQSSYGMIRAAASSTEPEQDFSGSMDGSAQELDVDVMDVDETGGGRPINERGCGGSGDAGYETPFDVPPKRMEAITLSDSEDEDHLTADQLVGELSKSIRAGPHN